MMKLKWQDAEYGKGRGSFRVFSNLVVGKGDFWLRFLPDYQRFWTKKIILKPVSDNPQRFFFPAFWSRKHGKCQYYPEIRMVEQGPFCMTLGPDDCEFFVISKEKINSQENVVITLEIIGYCRLKGRYDLY